MAPGLSPPDASSHALNVRAGSTRVDEVRQCVCLIEDGLTGQVSKVQIGDDVQLFEEQLFHVPDPILSANVRRTALTVRSPVERDNSHFCANRPAGSSLAPCVVAMPSRSRTSLAASGRHGYG